jgi:RNA polymerase sigma-70 factor, ECF subfamily
VSEAGQSPGLQGRDDQELMRLLAEGRHDALEVLVRRHQPKVLALAYRFLHRWELAEDVCQDAFLRVFQTAADYRPTAAFTTWLYRIVANLCWDRRRRAALEPSALPGEANDRHDPATPVPRIEQAERELRVRRAVAQLPDRQRLVLILHRYSDFSYKEIEEITGWSAGAVESCLMRAYGRLRELLADLRG